MQKGVLPCIRVSKQYHKEAKIIYEVTYTNSIIISRDIALLWFFQYKIESVHFGKSCGKWVNLQARKKDWYKVWNWINFIMWMFNVSIPRLIFSGKPNLLNSK